MLSRALLFAATVAVISHAHAQTGTATTETQAGTNSPTTTTAPATQRPILSQITGIFDGDLPQLDIPGTIKLTLRPHFGDLIRRDYMRTEAGFRWAFNESFEINTNATVYFTHGLDDYAGHGIGRVRFGSRYIIDDWPRDNYDVSLSLRAEAPVGHPPVDMTDGQYHLMPSIIVQRASLTNSKISTFYGLGFDFIDASSIPGEFGTNQPREDSVNTTLGAIYDLGQLKYTLSGTYATTAGLGNETEHFFYVQPAVQWYLPRRYTFNSRTQWIAGLSVRTSFGPDGTDVNVSLRLRAELTFRQVLQKLRISRGEESPTFR